MSFIKSICVIVVVYMVETISSRSLVSTNRMAFSDFHGAQPLSSVNRFYGFGRLFDMDLYRLNTQQTGLKDFSGRFLDSGRNRLGASTFRGDQMSADLAQSGKQHYDEAAFDQHDEESFLKKSNSRKILVDEGSSLEEGNRLSKSNGHTVSQGTVFNNIGSVDSKSVENNQRKSEQDNNVLNTVDDFVLFNDVRDELAASQLAKVEEGKAIDERIRQPFYSDKETASFSKQ